MIKGWIHQDAITIINIHRLNKRASKYMKWKVTVDSWIIRVGDFPTPISINDRTTRQNISNNIEGLDNTINQFDLSDIYRTLLTMTAEYTLFSCTYGTFFRICPKIINQLVSV